ncbi:hypothetical protein [Rheinheimera aquimaris]|uniref:hypothetical protein n=1 Tax=Rheinheimera aquimaris TaxID=412437 RepID=UPI001066AFA4|nr:hypothetical protein [Rheinheimera aquimaris]
MTQKAPKSLLGSTIYSRYWQAYGGSKALLKSGYLWSALAISAVLYPLWSTPGWWELVLSIIPNLLGFSLGGFALWLAIGDDGFRKVITDKAAEQCSAYASINASFVHFILVQAMAVVAALLAKGYNFALPADVWVIKYHANIFYTICAAGSYLGFSLFVYALFSALAATMGLFRITQMYEYYLNIEKKNDSKPASEQ